MGCAKKVEPDSKLTRVQINLSEKNFKILNLIKENFEASSYVETYIRIQKIIKFLLDKKNSGSEIIIRNPDGSETSVEFL